MVSTTQSANISSIDEFISDPLLGWLRGRLNHRIQGNLKGLRLLLMTEEQLREMLDDPTHTRLVINWLTINGYGLRTPREPVTEKAKSLIQDFENAPVLDFLLIDTHTPYQLARYSSKVSLLVQTVEIHLLGEPLTFAWAQSLKRSDLEKVVIEAKVNRSLVEGGVSAIIDQLYAWGVDVPRHQ